MFINPQCREASSSQVQKRRRRGRGGREEKGRKGEKDKDSSQGVAQSPTFIIHQTNL
jgi:hypothetical protein